MGSWDGWSNNNISLHILLTLHASRVATSRGGELNLACRDLLDTRNRDKKNTKVCVMYGCLMMMITRSNPDVQDVILK